MKVSQNLITIRTGGQGTYEFTSDVARALSKSGQREGTVSIYCRHTSCSLVIMENADPSALRDLERFLNKLVPENPREYSHTMEGPDDMPSHIKMALTRTSEVIPFSDGRLGLGTWQGLFLWEHRRRPHLRSVQVTILGS